MTVGYEDFPIESDPDVLARQMLARLAALQPRWVPHDGSPITGAITVMAQFAADQRALIPPPLAEAFRAFGRSVHALPQIDPASAGTTSTWVLRDTAGHTIPAGTQLAWRPNGAPAVGLRTVDNIVVPPGDSAVSGVALVVDLPGTQGNGIPATQLQLLDALAYVATVTTDGTTAGGLDGETAEQYVGRLAERLTVPTRTPVRPEHFALLARDIPGVTRALGVANYDADTDTDDVPACVTVYPLAADGQPVGTPVRDAVLAYLQGLREAGFIVRTGVPAYTAVHIAYQAVAEVGYTAEAVKAAIDLRASQLLDPALFAGGDARIPTWRPQQTIPIGWVQQQLGSVDGVAYLSGLTLNGASIDLVLPGRAPLPMTPGPSGSTVTGTVTTP